MKHLMEKIMIIINNTVGKGKGKGKVKAHHRTGHEGPEAE
jgi:hypothetical protein